MAKVKNTGADRLNRPHFNALDAIIIILVIAAIVGVYFRYSILDIIKGEGASKDYVITYSLDDIRYTTPTYIHVDDSVYFTSNGKLFGTLLSESENQDALNIMPASKSFVDSNGEVREVFYPNNESRVTARGRLLCSGYYDSDGGFYVDGNIYIAAGQTVAVRTETVSVNMRILSIDLYAQ